MDRRSMVGLIAVVAIVAVTMFAGCVEEPKYEEGAGKPIESKNLTISSSKALLKILGHLR